MVDVTRNALKRKRRTPDELAAYFQKAEPRWEKRRRKAKHFTLAWRRRRELQIIFQHRYPGGVPAHIEVDELVWVDTQTLGNSLGLTAKERSMWNITTIRPCDQTVEERAVLRKARRRERDRMRRIHGRQPRAEYLAANALSRTKPWEAEGISRRTYYRRLAQVGRGTGMSPTTYSYMGGDAVVPPANPAAPATTRGRTSSEGGTSLSLHWHGSLPHAALSVPPTHIRRLREDRAGASGLL